MRNKEEIPDTAEQEITVPELALLEKDSYLLIDVRDEMAYAYGHLPGALHIPSEQLENRLSELGESKVVIYCKRGEASTEAVKLLRVKGIEAYSLKGGYTEWLMEAVKQDKQK